MHRPNEPLPPLHPHPSYSPLSEYPFTGSSLRDAAHDVRVQQRGPGVLVRQDLPPVLVERDEPPVDLHDLERLPVRHAGSRLSTARTAAGLSRPGHREQHLAGGLPLHGGGRLPEALLDVRADAVQDGEVPRVPLVRVGVFGRVDVRGGLAVVVEVEPCEGAAAVVAPFFLALVRVLVVPPFVDRGEVFRLFFALLVPLWSGGGGGASEVEEREGTRAIDRVPPGRLCAALCWRVCVPPGEQRMLSLCVGVCRDATLWWVVVSAGWVASSVRCLW
jgi:hypothetical protein